jgi:hypothetical protein
MLKNPINTILRFLTIIITVLFLFSTDSFADNYDVWLIKTDSSGDTMWTYVYGGSDDDKGESVHQTSDRGYIIAGSTASYGAGSYDIWLIKTDSLGDTLWTKTFGGGEPDYAKCVQQTTDGGYIIIGYTGDSGPSGNQDLLLIKTDSLGTKEWEKIFGGTMFEQGWSVQQTPDHGFILTGMVYAGEANGWPIYGVWLIKTDASGDTLWTKIFKRLWVGPSLDYGRCIDQTTDGGYFIVAYTDPDPWGWSDAWFIKTNASGDTVWTKQMDGGQQNIDNVYHGYQTSDSGYIITGVNFDGAWLIKLKPSGDTLWTKTYDSYDGHCVQQTQDRGYVIAGNDWSSPRDAWLYKIDSLGIEEWEKTYGGNDHDFFTFVEQTEDSGYIMTGYTQSFLGIGMTGFLATAKSNYIELQWKLEMENACLQYLILKKSIKEDKDYYEIARIPGSGSSSSTKTYSYRDENVKPGIRYFYKLGVVKSNGSTNWYGPVSAAVRGMKSSFIIHPNPFSTSTTIILSSAQVHKNTRAQDIELSIYDASGRIVRTFPSSLFTHHSSVTWDGRDEKGNCVKSGIYFLKLRVSGEKSIVEEVRKVIKIE